MWTQTNLESQNLRKCFLDTRRNFHCHNTWGVFDLFETQMKSMCDSFLNCIILGHILSEKRKSQNDNHYKTNFVVIMYSFPANLGGRGGCFGRSYFWCCCWMSSVEYPAIWSYIQITNYSKTIQKCILYHQYHIQVCLTSLGYCYSFCSSQCQIKMSPGLKRG